MPNFIFNYAILFNKFSHNTTIDNKIEIFNNLCFHGGPGNV